MGEGKRIFFLYRELIRIASHHQKEKPQADPLLSFSFSKFFNQRLVDLSQFVSLFFFLAVGCSWLCLSPICREFSFLSQWTILVHRRTPNPKTNKDIDPF
jgi:hypothetical protein